MKRIIVFFLFLYSFTGLCQKQLQKTSIVEKYWRYDFSEDALNFYFGLKHIKDSPYKYSFRYKQLNRVYNLYSNDTVNFHGTVLNTIVHYNYPDKINHKGEYIYNVMSIEDSIATKAAKIILDNNLFNIPGSKDIEEWNPNWLDCPGAGFVLKKNTLTKETYYRCPGGQSKNDIPEINSITKSIKELNAILDKRNSYSSFKNQLEKGEHYYTGLNVLYIMPDKQVQRWKDSKPMRVYLKMRQDEINIALQEQIERLYEEKFDCTYNTYMVIFSKKGKLKYIETDEFFDSDDRKCFRIIKRILKKVDLSKLSLQYGFIRNLNFNGTTCDIEDTMVYE